MKFYDRKQEIEILTERINSPQFELIYLLWKRRVGKTELIQHLNTNVLHADFLYVFVEKMDFPVMLRNLEEMMYEKTQIAYHFRGVEQFLDAFFLQDTFTTLVIDEFQNFEAVDKSIFSTFQKVVDKYRNKSQKKIVVLGSIQSMMIKIFENAREPLYKRATQSMMIKEFDVDTQIEILQDMFGKKYTHRILLDSYTLFSGIPYYLSSLESRHYQDYNLKRILQDLFFNDFALLRNEGKEILIEEFGQKYRRFFAILEAISTGKTRRNEIMQAVWLWTGEIDFYLKELLEIYDIIEVKYPLYQEKTNLSRYAIKDNFLSFRFKYVYANKELFALWNYEILLQQTVTDFPSYQGFAFERLVKDRIILKNSKAELGFPIRKIGSRMDRKNHEIDLIYTDEKEHIVFLECKLSEKRITSAESHQLQQNVALFLDKHPERRNKKIKIWFAVFDEKEIVKFVDSASFL